MHKNVAVLGLFAVSVVLLSTLGQAEAKAQVLESLSLQHLAVQLQTPEAIARYMWRHFQYETDRHQRGVEDHWQAPEELLESKAGDCEDFALFAHKMLRLNGTKSFLFNVYGNIFGHTVCVFEENGKLHVIDGSKVIRHEASSLEELAEQIYPFWRAAAVVTTQEKTTSDVFQNLEASLRAHRQLAISS